MTPCTCSNLGPPCAPLTSPHIPLQTPLHATHLPTTPHSPGIQVRAIGDTCIQDRQRWRPVTPPPRCHRFYKEIRGPVPDEVECPKKVWTRGCRAPAPPWPSPNRVFPYSSLGHAQPRWITSASGSCPAIGPSRPLDSASCAAIGQRAGPRPIFLESSWKSVKGVSFRGPWSQKPERTPPPAPLRGLVAQPAVLGSRRFREGLGHKGQKIRRLAPPRPSVPPHAPSRPAGAAASQLLTAVCATRLPVLHWLPSAAAVRPSPSSRAASAAAGTWSSAFRGKRGCPPQPSLHARNTGLVLATGY